MSDGELLPEPSDAVRTQIDAIGETAAYAQGYADGVGQAAEKLREERWIGWAEGFGEACQLADTPPGPRHVTVNRRRPLRGAGLRTRVRQS